MHSPSYRGRTEKEYIEYCEAIDKALADLEGLSNCEGRRYAIDAILIEQTRTIEGVARELSYHWRMVQNWITEFVNAVGRYKGFEES